MKTNIPSDSNTAAPAVGNPHTKRSHTLLTAAAAMALGIAALPAAAQTTILISDLDQNGKVVRFDAASGEVIDHFVGRGISPLNAAHYMTLTPDGQLLVSSKFGHSVERYNAKTGQFIDTFISSGLGGLNQPRGLAYGPDGDLYVASGANGQVLRYDSTSGDFLGVVAVGISTSMDLMFSADGTRLFVTATASDRVMMFDPSDGTFLGDVNMSGMGLNNPLGMAQDAASNIYVSSGGSDRVIRIEAGTLDTSIFITPGLGGLDSPHGLEFDDTGNLLVVSVGNDSLLKYDANGQFVETVFSAATDGGLVFPVGLLLYTPCTADYNDDGLLDFFDVQEFLNAFSAGCPE